MERQLFFLILFSLGLYLILDQISGKQYLGNFIRSLIMGGGAKE